MNKLSAYLSSLSTTLKGVKDVHNVFNSKVAIEFNPFNFWRSDENKLSQLLAFFLDPNENHAQDDKFLKIFLERFGFSQRTGNVTCVCERTITNNRRIDILLTFDDRFAIAIENKPYAADQYEQIHDYDLFLSNYFKDNYCLLYLTPNGAQPASYI